MAVLCECVEKPCQPPGHLVRKDGVDDETCKPAVDLVMNDSADAQLLGGDEEEETDDKSEESDTETCNGKP
jgi:hypothetical protein